MMAREADGREASPTAGVIDSQSVKTTEAGGPRGFDAGKKIKGRKRHLLTDTAGFLIAGIVHEASVQDRDGAPALLQLIRSAFPWVRHVFADGARLELRAGFNIRKDELSNQRKNAPRRSRASGWSLLTTPWGFPCCVRFPCVHAVATTPVQRLGVLFALLHPAVSAFPERVVGSACALSFSRLARRSLALRPAHSRCHQFVTR